MAQIAGGEIDQRLSFCDPVNLWRPNLRPQVHFELTLLHFEGLSPRSRNIGGAFLCDHRFQLGMRAMTAVVQVSRTPA